MKLSRLSVANIRNLSQVNLDDLAPVNIFHGANGAGKTSVLEAVHILGLARSFRSTQLLPVIQYQQSSCTVFGELDYDNGQPPLTIGVHRPKKGGFRAKIGGEEQKSLVNLAAALPLQLLNASTYRLLEEGPRQRRQFVDWGVFHVEPLFYQHWQAMQRCVRQRNAVLRRGGIAAELKAWDAQLCELSAQIDAARSRYIALFLPKFEQIMAVLTEIPGLTVSYRPGWDRSAELRDVLVRQRETDSRRGFTHSGPHRADLKVAVNGVDAGQVLSRGQQKLVISAMRLAQSQLLSESTDKRCLLLVDDLPAEVDAEHLARLCGLLASLNLQLFMSCVDAMDLFEQDWRERTPATFHVHQGVICRD